MADIVDAATLAQHLDDPIWRLSNLYKIIVKGDDEDEGLVMQFKPNRAQRRLLTRLWHRNIILKARQLGFTTLIAIVWLDTALFSKGPIRCGIIAQDTKKAQEIFRDKVKFAYDNLPAELRERFPLESCNKSEIIFAHNGASIQVSTSMRSGTIHRLHISEFGKISALSPAKAKEVVTGSIPSVPKSGLCVIESTAEGQDGYFYSMTMLAKAMAEKGTPLSPKDWRFHFYPWWEASEYTLPADDVVFTEADNAYFLKIESQIRRRLSPEQRAWYVVTRRSDFSDEAPLMWQEYPSTPEEAFQVSTEGCYYATQLAQARTQGRVLPSLPVLAIPVNTFWDIGRGDMTTIWFHQRVGPENRFIRYYENSGEDLLHYVEYMQKLGYVFGQHFLPHEADAKRMGKTPDTNQSIKEMLEELMPGQKFEIVPRISAISAGIQATRAAFASSWFSEEGCKDGLGRLGNYRKRWDKVNGRWTDEPLHDDASHGADAYRQFGQVSAAGIKFIAAVASVARVRSSSRRRGSPMAV